ARCVVLPGNGERPVLRVATARETPVEEEGVRDGTGPERGNLAVRVWRRRRRIREDLELVRRRLREAGDGEEEQVKGVGHHVVAGGELSEDLLARLRRVVGWGEQVWQRRMASVTEQVSGEVDRVGGIENAFRDLQVQ